MQITLNFAITADGKISTRAKTPSTFTSHADLERLWEIRRRADAILVGRGTLEADHMTLTIPPSDECHPPRQNQSQALRCIVSRHGNFNPAHPIFQKPGGDIHLLATDPSADFSEKKYPGARLHRQSLPAFLQTLEKELGVEKLLCEGGGELTKALFALDLVDTLHLTLATHHLFGGRDAPTITGIPGDFLPASRHFTLAECEPCENGEIFLTYACAHL